MFYSSSITLAFIIMKILQTLIVREPLRVSIRLNSLQQISKCLSVYKTKFPSACGTNLVLGPIWSALSQVAPTLDCTAAASLEDFTLH